MINITAKNFTLTQGIKNNIYDKLSKFSKFMDDGEKMDVVLDTNQNRQKVEVFFKVKNKSFKAESSDNDLYVAIDLVMDKMQKQIRRHLDKEGSVKNESVRFAEYPSLTKEVAENKKDNTPKIVKRKFVSSKPMFEAEAIEQMELLEHRSFIFYNADTETVCMLYKRHDGDYGIIETE